MLLLENTDYNSFPTSHLHAITVTLLLRWEHTFCMDVFVTENHGIPSESPSKTSSLFLSSIPEFFASKKALLRGFSNELDILLSVVLHHL